MKNYVTLNQGNFIKIGNRKSIKVDTIDATLFDWIKTFTLSNNAMKLLIDNELYIWVSYQAIREDNPLCNISTNDAVGRRLNKLIDLGILKKYLSKEDGNKTFFCITEFAYTYLLENRELPTQESEPLPTQESDNSKLINSKLDRIKKIYKKENLAEQFIKEKNVTQQSNKDLVIDFVEYRKLIKKPLRTIAPIQQLIDNLILLKDLGYSFEYCIEQMKSNEWQTVKKDYIHKPKPQSFKKSNTDGNAEFIRQHYGINEDNVIDTEII